MKTFSKGKERQYTAERFQDTKYQTASSVLTGVVDRVTFHNPNNGWSILRIIPLDSPTSRETVTVHQVKVIPGATMEFSGNWIIHPKYGRQFNARKAIEKKPASISALERYIGSGLIKGIGPKTAKKIVQYFKAKTLDIFEQDIDRLIEIPGIAFKKLETISIAWREHRAIRDVMMFLQSHNISTLFAVKIYQKYGNDAISKIAENPYCLVDDFYGIGFFSADKVALSIGFAPNSEYRIMAGIRHVLSAARNFGHCYLTRSQIDEQAQILLNQDLNENLTRILYKMEAEKLIIKRVLNNRSETNVICYYAKSLYFDEIYVANRIKSMNQKIQVDEHRIERWLKLFSNINGLKLSTEQSMAIRNIIGCKFSILTGGPGCGKTTTTKIMVRLLEAMGFKTLLAAPTGRAAQRMSELIGRESKTIHRLLEWKGEGFKRNEKAPLVLDALIVDECSMLDINLTASLLRAIPLHARVVFIGDYHQLPSVGAGNVLKDIVASGQIPCFRLTKIFRQAARSQIIQFSHKINTGHIPWIESPFKQPHIWTDKTDCMFLDSEQATNEQMQFIAKVKWMYKENLSPDIFSGDKKKKLNKSSDFILDESSMPYESRIKIPEKFSHINLEHLTQARTSIEELIALLKHVSPWSSLHYGLEAVDVVKKLYIEWIPKYYGDNCEIQILAPMLKGSLGTQNLNQVIQAAVNPWEEDKPQIQAARRLFRVGDRVIHKKNNYDLGIFNGEIGQIVDINTTETECVIHFYPDNRKVIYKQSDIMELDLAYAITIHKSQGSEFEAVIIPVFTQHFPMLFRNVIYTGLTRARKLAVFVGNRQAMAMAINNKAITLRQTALKDLLV